MSSRETTVSKAAQVEASKLGSRLFRNNRGLFYTMSGEKTKAGLQTDGASDLIGLTPIVITQEMVGRTVAVFTAVEAKVPEWTKPQKKKSEQDQKTFIEWVVSMGGIAFFCNDAKNIKKHLDSFKEMR